ncbi:MAG: tetratricopeptide repeat protein [Candidatus Lokiarchaeota archaeon]|nr:tetratricopeptide repeat protein [Candidatus Lokiarchaeota archaeon]MBD3341757.1 tetratricopeptide repeat protein [Candidatus Lokiarchaeota archaeon]
MNAYKTLKRLLRKGNRYRKKGNIARAVKMYKKALEINPFSKKAYRKLAQTYRKANDLHQAIEIVQHCLKFHPKDDIIMFDLANFYKEIGDYKNAIDTYNQVAKIAPHREMYIQNLIETISLDENTPCHKLPQKTQKIVQIPNFCPYCGFKITNSSLNADFSNQIWVCPNCKSENEF